ncbi:MAG TPA: TIR domain-containing protein [Candidatus Sulfotelmatobacter sp.]|nr:TIR domain-containing protein [Candidatus Sulfotelmatobacter sp.]
MAKNAAKVDRGRTYISQADVPSYSLEKALRIPLAIGDNYGYKPTTPLQVAKALELAPGTGGFKMLTGAAIAYGLTTGGYNASIISITPLGMRIVRPTSEGDDIAAKREALLKPRVIREFLNKYNAAPVPKDGIAQNVLMEMGVPQERTLEVLNLIMEGAEAVGFLQTIKDRKYVELGNTSIPEGPEGGDTRSENGRDDEPPALSLVPPPPVSKPLTTTVLPAAPLAADNRVKKVFITHGKNKLFIDPIRKLLAFGELEAVVADEKQTVSQPVPEKVMSDMRSCGAAIIHVEDEQRLMDKDVKEHIVLNSNVLIEIGAAMALYGQRFILVVKEGIELPSNLQGLYQVRYSGDTLDGTATIKLLEAINDMKKRALPAPTGV